MKILNKITVLVLFLLAASSVTALENSELRREAELDGLRALAATREIIFEEMVANAAEQSPFLRPRELELFGVDDIGLNTTLRHNLYMAQSRSVATKQTDNGK